MAAAAAAAALAATEKGAASPAGPRPPGPRRSSTQPPVASFSHPPSDTPLMRGLLRKTSEAALPLPLPLPAMLTRKASEAAVLARKGSGGAHPLTMLTRKPSSSGLLAGAPSADKAPCSSSTPSDPQVKPSPIQAVRSPLSRPRSVLV